MSHRVAPLELAAFLAATRPDWDPLEIQQAIDRARIVDWPYEHFVGAVLRTAWDDDATPQDVTHMRPRGRIRRPWTGDSW